MRHRSKSLEDSSPVDLPQCETFDQESAAHPEFQKNQRLQSQFVFVRLRSCPTGSRSFASMRRFRKIHDSAALCLHSWGKKRAFAGTSLQCVSPTVVPIRPASRTSADAAG